MLPLEDQTLILLLLDILRHALLHNPGLIIRHFDFLLDTRPLGR